MSVAVRQEHGDLDLGAILDALARHTADAQLLAAEAKAWHWTVTGPNFGELHELFEEIAGKARESTDHMAERMVQLGGTPPAFPKEWLERGRLDVPQGGKVPPVTGMLDHMVDSLGRISGAVREDVLKFQDGDPATADILIEWLRTVDKCRWMVEAYRA